MNTENLKLKNCLIMMVRNTLAFLLLLLCFQICFRAFKSLAQTLRKKIFFIHIGHTRANPKSSSLVTVSDFLFLAVLFFPKTGSIAIMLI